MGWRDNCDFSELTGKTITRIEGMDRLSDCITFHCSDGSVYNMLHYQDCCESVDIEDICGDVNDLLNSPILRASEDTNRDDAPPEDRGGESYTWTFYNIATVKGHVTIRWFGSSNGYYSESVSFEKVNPFPN